MHMHNPPHPGEVLRGLCLEPLGLSITEAAEGLGVSRNNLSSILNGRTGISPEMAIRLQKAFGGTAETWLNMQLKYELYHAEKQSKKIKVKTFRPAKEFPDDISHTS
jgi:antitoxin HigA-1